MISRLSKLIFLSVIILFCIPTNSFLAAERKVALVIGNSNYLDAPLKNPVNDATDMASALRKLGFRVTLKTDANQRVMETAVRSFGKKIRKGGVGLFYYAGHGLQVRGNNYLIPIGAEIESEGDVKYEAMDAGLVLAKMEDAGNGLNIIILDACRNNPFARSFRSADKGLAKMDAPTGSILAYATAPGSVAADGIKRNGLYTAKLLQHITVPGLEIGRLFREVRKDVVKTSGKKQTPWESSSLMGDFYFNPEKTGLSQPVRAIGVQQRKATTILNAEEEMWEIVKTSSATDDYAMFLDEYPKSRFGGAAKLKIQQLKRKQNAKLMLASVAPSVISVKIVARDGDFEKLSNDVVYDKITGLEWYAGPDEEVNWREAKLRVKSLEIDGGGWRMPTKEEILTLYKNGAGTKNMTPLLTNSSWWVWFKKSGFDIGGRGAGAYNFYLGPNDYKSYKPSSFNRAFAVRKRN
jgi:hypothetical protein